MHSFNFSNNPMKDWHTDQNWILLDPTVKGFFSQLVLSSSQTKPYGHITSNEKRIKKIIGIPHVEISSDDNLKNYEPKKNDLQKTLKTYFDTNELKGISAAMLESLAYSIGDEDLDTENGNILYNIQHSYNIWVNFLWKHKWKTQLETVMKIIDEDLISEFPELEGKEGDYFIPIAYNIGFQKNNKSIPVQVEEIKTKTIKKSRKKEKIEIIEHEDIYFELDRDLEIKSEALKIINYDSISVFSFKNVYKALTKPLSEEDKTTIWDLGISLISLSKDKSDISKARGIMAKAMKTYGKEATISAITKMSLIKDKQLNPHAYFIKLLEIDKTENEEVERKTKSKLGSNNTLVML